MATQPNLGGQGPSSDNHHDHSLDVSSSSTQLPGNFNNPTPPQTPPPPLLQTPPQTPPQTPAVSESPSPTVDDTTPPSITNSTLNQEHYRCLIEMETNRDRVLTHAFSNPIGDFLRGMIGVFCALAYTLFQLLLGIGTLLYLFPFYSMVLGLIILFIIRHFVLVSGRVDPKKLRAGWKSTRAPHYVLIVCGSGGHTGEMIRMVERSIRPTANSHRRWAIGHDDRLSFEKVLEFERRLGQTLPNVGTFDILYFRRGRAIHQSWLTTPFTALNSLIHVILVLVSPPGRRNAPEFCFPGVVVSDGPGTGFLVFLAAHLLKLFFVVPEEYMKTVFVESWARVNSLSLSGWLIHMFALADVFIVQHRRLAKRYGVSYTGNMVGMPTSPNVPMH